MSGSVPPPLPPRSSATAPAPLPPPPLPPPVYQGSPLPPLPLTGSQDVALGASGPDALKARYVAAARALVERNHAGAEGEGCVGFVVILLIVICTLTIVLIPVSVWLFRKWKQIRRTDSALREAVVFAERAVPVMAFPLMVNSMLRRPGTNRAPGLFLISFEPGKGDSIDFMGDLAVRVGEGTEPGMSDADRAFCRRLMADEEHQFFRRRRIPATLTGGATVYAIDLGLTQLLLAGRHISDEMPLVPCMAEPGDDGRVMQAPYWLLNTADAPGQSEREEFDVTLASVHEWTTLSRRPPIA